MILLALLAVALVWLGGAVGLLAGDMAAVTKWFPATHPSVLGYTAEYILFMLWNAAALLVLAAPFANARGRDGTL